MKDRTKALVIGSSGLVGGALLRALECSGISWTATHRSRPGRGTERLDVTDPDSVARCFDAARPDVAFLAVNTPGGVDFCETHPEEARALNVEGTRNVARAAARLGCVLVYYSTDYVFDGKGGPYSEGDPTGPINGYGRTKLEAESVVRALVPRHLIVRTASVFGWDRNSKNFAMQVWERLGQGKALRAVDDQWGNATLADYLAETSVRLVQKDAGGVFNVVGKECVTRFQLAVELARALDLDPALVVPVSAAELSQVAPRPIRGGLVTEKLERILGGPAQSLSEALERLRRHFKSEIR